jgi:hypothetical protein
MMASVSRAGISICFRMESCGPGKPCRRADNASLPAPNDKHADAKANQIFYHTLPCRATFLVVFEEDFFS